MIHARRIKYAALIFGTALLAVAVGSTLPLPPWLTSLIAVGIALAPALVLLLRADRAHEASNQQTHEFIQHVLDAVPHPMFVRDDQSCFLFANAAYARHVGKDQAEIIGHGPAEIMTNPNIAELMAREDQGVLTEGTPVLKEIRSLHPVGIEPRYMLISKGRCVGPQGRTMVVGSYVDVSHWRRAELALQEAVDREVARRERVHAYVQRLIDVIPQPVYIKNAQSRYVLVNDAFCKERGRSKEDLMGQLSYALTADEALRAGIHKEDQEVLEGRVIFKEEHLPHMYTGKERFRVISKGSCLDAEGEPVIVGANFDVTPWRIAERELAAALEREVERRKRTQEYVQRLIDVIPQPVYVKDADSYYIMTNEAYARDRQMQKEDMIGKLSTTPLNDSLFYRKVMDEDARVLAGEVILKEEHKAHPVSGKERFRIVSKGSCQDAEGRQVIVCAVFDITEWRLAEARLVRAKEVAERANEAKTLFLANMSHELRTPMHAILSFARLGESRTIGEGQEKVHGYFERVVHSGERLLNLLNDLLDLSKLEAGRIELALRPMDMRICIQEALSEFSALLEAKVLAVDLDCCTPSMIEGDMVRIGQVMRNLLSNAIKYGAPRSTISIQLERFPSPAKNELLELRVIDQGQGIPENELEAVFDKFYQSSKTRTGAGGTGLGLAICREIVRAHEGEIFARNHVGGGAEFIIRLPAIEEREIDSAAPSAAAIEPRPAATPESTPTAD